MKQLELSSPKFYWTKHAREKLNYYGLSENRVKRVLRHPDRVETGITKDTLVCVQQVGPKKHPTEIWVMYMMVGEIKKIISAWRYPGITEPQDPIPVPEDISNEWITPPCKII